ncbi:protein FAM199X-B-like [Glandiceps talaboti]
MIAESSVTLTSPWSIEPLFSKEHQAEFFNKYIAPSGNNLDMDITAIEAEIERVKQHKEATQALKASGSSTSCSMSGTSSECSDDAFIDVCDVGDDDHLFSTPDNDYISNSILNILEEGNITDGVSLSTFEWTDSELELQVANNVEVSNSDSQSDTIPSLHNSPIVPRKRRKVTDNTQWSSLTCEEKSSVVEYLGQTISDEMGLREQMEIIRIINPNAVILPTDSEFVIDIQSLNDEKLQRIREYIKKNSSDGEMSNNTTCNNTPSRNSHKSSDESSSNESRCSSSPEQRIKPSKKQTREKRNQIKAQRQKQRKEHRQAMKEKRSGLFRKEEVVSLTICEVDEDEEEVDIL